MKAEELMIGDWVQFPYGIRKVTELDSFLDRVLSEDFSVTEVDAIPLTPEILKENGFVYSELPFEQSWQQYGLSLYAGGDGYRINCGENVALVIDSVHQLQHALRLCGIDKEIEL